MPAVRGGFREAIRSDVNNKVDWQTRGRTISPKCESMRSARDCDFSSAIPDFTGKQQMSVTDLSAAAILQCRAVPVWLVLESSVALF